jgi:hypothetical protein
MTMCGRVGIYRFLNVCWPIAACGGGETHMSSITGDRQRRINAWSVGSGRELEAKVASRHTNLSSISAKL